MLQAYVGIVSHQGLEVFCPEHPQTVRFLERHARRTHGKTTCFWSVLPDESATLVQAALHAGQPRAALQLLQQAARDLGPLFPAPAEPADEWVIRADR